MEEVVDVALQNGQVLVGYAHPRLVEVADHRLDAFADGGTVLRGALGRPAVDELVELVGRPGADEDVDVTLAVEQALDQVPPDEPCPPGHETRHCRTLSRHARLPASLRPAARRAPSHTCAFSSPALAGGKPAPPAPRGPPPPPGGIGPRRG